MKLRLSVYVLCLFVTVACDQSVYQAPLLEYRAVGDYERVDDVATFITETGEREGFRVVRKKYIEISGAADSKDAFFVTFFDGPGTNAVLTAHAGMLSEPMILLFFETELFDAGEVQSFAMRLVSALESEFGVQLIERPVQTER